MKQVFLGGPSGVIVEDVPAPQAGPGEVLVRTAHTLISTGTEGSGVQSTAARSGSPIERVLKDPALVARAARKLVSDGLGATAKAVSGNTPRDLTPLGYSASGVVVDVGSDVTGIAVGDRVACAGGGYASHAEYIAVPKNLVVPLPDALPTLDGAFVTLGAIAMQGVRRAGIGLGDRVGVVGLGLLGQLGVQLAAAAGCQVIGFDLDTERVALAIELGAAEGVVSTERDPVSASSAFSDGVGLDAVLIFAGTKSSDVVNQAFEMTRERGKVVIVGAVGMELERKTFYNREQDLLISRSYGPGRYDSSYEEGGADYPIAYVRWTENRNMSEFLRLVASGAVRTEPLVNAVFPIDQAGDAYASALDARGPRVATLLSYTPAEDPLPDPASVSRVTVLREPATPAVGEVHFGIIGAGSFAKAFHIPNIAKIPGASVRAIAGRRGSSAVSSAKRADASYAATDPDELLADGDIDAVIIATRHDSHASLAIEAARAGKHVFVEKPLALTAEDCVSVAQAVEAAGVLLTVGFNRRFSPHAQLVKRVLDSRRGPKLMTYRVNAGFKPAGHWVFDPVEGGGRIVGEACHFFDLLTFFAGAEPVRVTASGLTGLTDDYAPDDNLVATIEFADGSVGQLVYAGNGDAGLGKERIEIFCDKVAISIDDFRETRVSGTPGAKDLSTKDVDKGHYACLKEFVDAVAGRGSLSTGVIDGVRGTVVALAVLESAHSGAPVDVRLPVSSADA